MPTIEDEIIADVLRGATERFGELVELHQRTLMVYLWNLLPNHHDCEEVVQEAFLQGFKNLSSFDPTKASFRTWMMVIARRRGLNLLAKKAPRTVSELPEASNEVDPAAALCRDEWQQQLDAALESLPFPQRSAFVLAEVQEMPYAQIAKIEDAAIGTIKSRVSRAKEHLRQRLAQLNLGPIEPVSKNRT